MIRARIRVDGMLAAVCRRFWGRRWRPTVAVVSEMAGKTRREALADRDGASWRRGSVGWRAGQWQTAAVRLEMAGRAIEPRRD